MLEICGKHDTEICFKNGDNCPACELQQEIDDLKYEYEDLKVRFDSNLDRVEELEEDKKELEKQLKS